MTTEDAPRGLCTVGSCTVKYLLWQFSAYAAVALVVGGVLGRRSMAWRVARAEREQQRAAFELSSLTMKASSLLEASGRERASIVDANARLAEELRTAREAQARVQADLKDAENIRAQAEASRRAVGQHVAATSGSRSLADAEAELERVRRELARRKTDDARSAEDAAGALAQAEIRARGAEDAHRELSRVHAAAVRSAQMELTRAFVRAEQAEAALASREASRSRVWAGQRGAPPERRESGATVLDLRDSRTATNRRPSAPRPDSELGEHIVDLRPFE